MYLYAHTLQNLILASNLIGRQYAQSLMWLPLARPRKYWNLAIVLSRSVLSKYSRNYGLVLTPKEKNHDAMTIPSGQQSVYTAREAL